MKEAGMKRRIGLNTMMVALGIVMVLTGMALAADAGKIDLNTATAEQLMSLDRIGQAVAKRIVDYREKNGPFATIEDLMKVQGIGEKVFAANKDRITVSAPVKK
jgi:competence ComEA-like helix-hairpin-helix protein